jgi:serine phosphatase RsbU (regulator of sigma subunit)
MALGSLRATFRALSTDAHGPGPLLTLMSDTLHDQWGGAPYVTAIVLEIDLEARCARYANAGHPAGLLAGRHGVRQLDSAGPPAGLLPSAWYAERTLPLEPGETCVLVTDGITEALGNDTAAIASLVERAGKQPVPPQVTCDRVMALALAAGGPAGVEDWEDDRTVVVFTLGLEQQLSEPINAGPRPTSDHRPDAA